MSAAILNSYDLVVIGAGPAGLAAAGKAAQLGCKRILLLERNSEPGGILNQCIHDGFGLERFGVSLTGPEYIERFLPVLSQPAVTLTTSAMVLKITPERAVQFADREGLHVVQAGAVILATGCRERTRGAIGVAGTRPAGVFTAGVVQRLVNMENIAVGKRAVILGSGDIGLIMARRLTLEGMEIACVLEKLPYCSGLLRNVRQCLIDYSIPLYLSTTVIEILGDHHLEAVVAAEVDASGTVLPETKRTIPCDTLILSVGLIPENELAKACGVKMDPVTGGALVDGRLMTNIPGVFSCGNGLHVHDIVDMVSEEAELAAQNAVTFIRNVSQDQPQIPVCAGNGVRYVLPRSLPQNAPGRLALRVQNPGTDQTVLVTQGKKTLLAKKMRLLSPAEMIRLSLPAIHANAGELRISLRQEQHSPAQNESELVCTCCPNGCALTAATNSKGKLDITGARCSRGVSFGLTELTDPRRTLTTTVRLNNGAYPLVSVRSAEPVRKDDLRLLVARLRAVTLTAPVHCGDRVPFDEAEILVTGRADSLEQ
ncbi:MAG: FAD-dependent oxidoreductase [Clostridiaceae bacterium]